MDVCQSCGMPMETPEVRGREKDGSPSADYCRYCYPDGEFNKPDETFEEMVETCVPFMVKEGMTEAKARETLTRDLKKLKRWA